jgi:hypothetical protein
MSPLLLGVAGQFYFFYFTRIVFVCIHKNAFMYLNVGAIVL